MTLMLIYGSFQYPTMQNQDTNAITLSSIKSLHVDDGFSFTSISEVSIIDSRIIGTNVLVLQHSRNQNTAWDLKFVRIL